MKSTALQTPSDLEATFRSKAGKEHRGYVANMEESVGKNGTIVTGYAYEQNIHSDSRFLKEHLEQDGYPERNRYHCNRWSLQRNRKHRTCKRKECKSDHNRPHRTGHGGYHG